MGQPHIVMLTISGQGHINTMLQLAKLLHSKGFYITFITPESTHQSILRSQDAAAADAAPLRGHEGFRFETIPDGLVSPTARSRQNVAEWCMATYTNCVGPFRDVLARLNSAPSVPRITCVVYNWLFSFALDVADELSIPALVFSPMGACGFMGDLHLAELIQRGHTPLKDESYLTNGYLDTPIDWIPGMEGIRLRDLSSFVRTVDAGDYYLDSGKTAARRSLGAKGLILNTFDFMEPKVVNALKLMFDNVYTIAPLPILLGHVEEGPVAAMRLDLWGEDDGYIEWLDEQEEGSVIYVNFGSIVTASAEQVTEFAWGLANSMRPCLWVIRPGLVRGGGQAVLPEDFAEKTKGRCYVASWCSQVQVLSHASVGGFLTHCGWNSMLEAVCAGVPMICWPVFADQPTIARYACGEWGIGMEMEEQVRRGQVTMLVKELMEGDRGKEMRKQVVKWKESAELAAMQGGSSYQNMERLANDLNAMNMGSV